MENLKHFIIIINHKKTIKNNMEGVTGDNSSSECSTHKDSSFSRNRLHLKVVSGSQGCTSCPWPPSQTWVHEKPCRGNWDLKLRVTALRATGSQVSF